jgi:molecular chaperone HscB
MAPDFLMQQMEWREALDDARAGRDLDALERLDKELGAVRRQELGRIGAALDGRDFAAAAQGVRQLMFLEKFGDEVAAAFDRLTD